MLVLVLVQAPVSAFVRLPLVVPPERANTQATPEEIAADTYSAFPPHCTARVQELEAAPWCLSAAVALTWAPGLGGGIVSERLEIGRIRTGCLVLVEKVQYMHTPL